MAEHGGVKIDFKVETNLPQYEILPRHTEVMIKQCNLPGIIKAVWIEGGNVQYKVSYFNSGTHAEVWLIEQEFTTNQIGRIKIGF